MTLNVNLGAFRCCACNFCFAVQCISANLLAVVVGILTTTISFSPEGGLISTPLFVVLRVLFTPSKEFKKCSCIMDMLQDTPAVKRARSGHECDQQQQQQQQRGSKRSKTGDGPPEDAFERSQADICPKPCSEGISCSKMQQQDWAGANNEGASASGASEAEWSIDDYLEGVRIGAQADLWTAEMCKALHEAVKQRMSVYPTDMDHDLRALDELESGAAKHAAEDPAVQKAALILTLTDKQLLTEALDVLGAHLM